MITKNVLPLATGSLLLALFCACNLLVTRDVRAFSPLPNQGKVVPRSFSVTSRKHSRQRQSTFLQATCDGKEFALLFDCDGVILETEEFHRLAYNAAFKAADLTIDGEPVEWSVEYYGRSKTIGIFVPGYELFFKGCLCSFANYFRFPSKQMFCKILSEGGNPKCFFISVTLQKPSPWLMANQPLIHQKSSRH